jgi:glycosyltransferase involved in cell wall biosynthesis
MPISVVVPSYRNPTYLDLCLKSLYEGQTEENEIIVILDGYAEESKDVVNKYKDLNVLALEENRKETFCHNIGVINATNEWVLILNDDNVAPRKWDMKLREIMHPTANTHNAVIAPNQIEPAPSIFKSIVIQDFGTTPDTFRYNDFLDFEDSIRPTEIFTTDGSTWPVFMKKKWYMALGGIDPYYPHSCVADWDLFYRCDLMELRLERFHGCHFYHFAGTANKSTPETAAAKQKREQESFAYFQYKWKFAPKRNTDNRINGEI